MAIFPFQPHSPPCNRHRSVSSGTPTSAHSAVATGGCVREPPLVLIRPLPLVHTALAPWFPPCPHLSRYPSLQPVSSRLLSPFTQRCPGQIHTSNALAPPFSLHIILHRGSVGYCIIFCPCPTPMIPQHPLLPSPRCVYQNPGITPGPPASSYPPKSQKPIPTR